ncbi:MAG: sulfite exporter TauE/SafE family protein [Chloroflexota bacterium]|nr:sulfite exporter TauE/SafE family protein [Chloroflexota bacterium]
MDLSLALQLGAVSALAAILGSMLGLGGGVFLVPIFTLFFSIDQKIAIGASAVAVVTNSVVGSSVHLRSRFTNLRLAMLLQVTTAIGAICGALIAVWANPRAINVLFGTVLIYAGISMLLRRQAVPPEVTASTPDPFRLGGVFADPATQSMVHYVPTRPALGLTVSGFAGMISGMLGIGGGVIQVPAMNLLMHVPVKAAAGTSSFMVGITAVATALVFYSQAKIDPTVVVPAIIGIFIGSQAGSRLTRSLRTQNLVVIFVLILLYLGGSLLLKSAGFTLPGQS